MTALPDPRTAENGLPVAIKVGGWLAHGRAGAGRGLDDAGGNGGSGHRGRCNRRSGHWRRSRGRCGLRPGNVQAQGDGREPLSVDASKGSKNRRENMDLHSFCLLHEEASRMEEKSLVCTMTSVQVLSIELCVYSRQGLEFQKTADL